MEKLVDEKETRNVTEAKIIAVRTISFINEGDSIRVKMAFRVRTILDGNEIEADTEPQYKVFEKEERNMENQYENRLSEGGKHKSALKNTWKRHSARTKMKKQQRPLSLRKKTEKKKTFILIPSF